MRLHQASEGGNCLHSRLALLWFTLFLFWVSHINPLINMPTDALAFLVIVILAVRSRFKGKMSRILRKIVQDTTLYFFVIFTSHFVLVMTLLLERVSIPIVCDGNDAEISPAEYPALAG